MKSLAVVLRLIVPLIAVAGCVKTESAATPTSSAAGPDNIPWRHDYKAALAEASQSGKLVLIDFSATWCGPCQQMKRQSWPDGQVQKLASGRFVPLALDTDDESARAAAERYQIESIPAILIVKPNGDVIRNQTGFMSPEALVDFLSQG